MTYFLIRTGMLMKRTVRTKGGEGLRFRVHIASTVFLRFFQTTTVQPAGCWMNHQGEASFDGFSGHRAKLSLDTLKLVKIVDGRDKHGDANQSRALFLLPALRHTSL